MSEKEKNKERGREREREREEERERESAKERSHRPHQSFYRVGLSDLWWRTTISVAHFRERRTIACYRMLRHVSERRRVSIVSSIHGNWRPWSETSRDGRRRTRGGLSQNASLAWLRAGIPVRPGGHRDLSAGTNSAPLPPPPRSISFIPFIESPSLVSENDTSLQHPISSSR